MEKKFTNHCLKYLIGSLLGNMMSNHEGHDHVLLEAFGNLPDTRNLSKPAETASEA